MNRFLISFSLLCTCCTINQNIFNTKEIVFDNFEREIPISGTVVNLDTIVMAPIGIYQVDSFLIFNHITGDYFFSLYNLQTKKFVGKFLQRGRGPNEFSNLSYWDEYTFQNNERWLYMSDNNLNCIFKFNLSGYFKTKTTQIELLHQYNGRQMKNHAINDTTFLSFMITFFDKEVRVFYRKYFSTSDRLEEIELTRKNVNGYEEFDKLWSAEYIRPDKKKMAMAMIHCNRIHIFDLEEFRNNITLVPKNQLNISLSELVKQDPLKTTIYYISTKATQDYIFALFQNIRISDYQQRLNKMEIHVFDWNGYPVFKLVVNEYINDFCVDWGTKIMYAFDYEENIYQYDLSHIL